jgi:hypothetical protein
MVSRLDGLSRQDSSVSQPAGNGQCAGDLGTRSPSSSRRAKSTATRCRSSPRPHNRASRSPARGSQGPGRTSARSRAARRVGPSARQRCRQPSSQCQAGWPARPSHGPDGRAYFLVALAYIVENLYRSRTGLEASPSSSPYHASCRHRVRKQLESHCRRARRGLVVCGSLLISTTEVPCTE